MGFKHFIKPLVAVVFKLNLHLLLASWMLKVFNKRKSVKTEKRKNR